MAADWSWHGEWFDEGVLNGTLHAPEGEAPIHVCVRWAGGGRELTPDDLAEMALVPAELGPSDGLAPRSGAEVCEHLEVSVAERAADLRLREWEEPSWEGVETLGGGGLRRRIELTIRATANAPEVELSQALWAQELLDDDPQLTAWRDLLAAVRARSPRGCASALLLRGAEWLLRQPAGATLARRCLERRATLEGSAARRSWSHTLTLPRVHLPVSVEAPPVPLELRVCLEELWQEATLQGVRAAVWTPVRDARLELRVPVLEPQGVVYTLAEGRTDAWGAGRLTARLTCAVAPLLSLDRDRVELVLRWGRPREAALDAAAFRRGAWRRPAAPTARTRQALSSLAAADLEACYDADRHCFCGADLDGADVAGQPSSPSAPLLAPLLALCPLPSTASPEAHALWRSVTEPRPDAAAPGLPQLGWPWGDGQLLEPGRPWLDRLGDEVEASRPLRRWAPQDLCRLARAIASGDDAAAQADLLAERVLAHPVPWTYALSKSRCGWEPERRPARAQAVAALLLLRVDGPPARVAATTLLDRLAAQVEALELWPSGEAHHVLAALEAGCRRGLQDLEAPRARLLERLWERLQAPDRLPVESLLLLATHPR